MSLKGSSLTASKIRARKNLFSFKAFNDFCFACLLAAAAAAAYFNVRARQRHNKKVKAENKNPG